ncbi:MAG: hypothetical protein ACRECJ_00750 [Limisphaerales bacterium]
MRAALEVGSKTLPFIGDVKKGRGGPLGAPATGVAENFLYAGTSAFLLLVANLFPNYWYLSFFALIPFLWRIVRLDALGALQLGLLFGFSFFSIWKLPDFLAAPVLTLLTIALGTVLFALFAWAVARAKEKFGFNPLFVALLWVLLELALITAINVEVNVGTNLAAHSTGFFHGLSVLFGFLAVSFVSVLVNSILVFAIEKTVSLAKARGQGVWENENVWDLTPIPGLFAQRVCLVSEGRGPPIVLVYVYPLSPPTDSSP